MPATQLNAESEKAAKPQSTYPPLDQVTTPNVDTGAAAHYLLRKRNTLRVWAMRGHPIKPLRVNGRLAWPVAEIRRLVSGGVQ